jgi:ferredoxin--NADP+ reductase
MPHYKIAIVGAGPAGYFAAQALQNSQSDELTFAIDMIERLPTPWGLVRSGVAPDHPKIKTVAKVFEKIAIEPNFRLFANVELGKDIFTSDLIERYDAVVMATGSAVGKKLGIPGENLKNSISAAEFVPWYNGHPDYADFDIDLSGKVAVVIGAGNVAMDCARMLALNPSELDSTDTADHALRSLHASNIRKVYICGRRGPEHAAFTAPELRELPKLEHTDVHMDAMVIADAHARAAAAGDIEKHLQSNLEAMRLVAETPKDSNEREMIFHFLAAPKEIKGAGVVQEVVFGINEVKNEVIVDSGKTFTIEADLVISAIGYESTPIEGVRFEKGKIANNDGRVPNSNVYAVGWAKRGPSGVIGTNKSDAADVIHLLIEDLKLPKVSGDITELLPAEHQVVTQDDWQSINAAEIAAGEPSGRPRVKATSVASLLGLGKA